MKIKQFLVLFLLSSCSEEKSWICEIPQGLIGTPCDETNLENQCVTGAYCFEGACREVCHSIIKNTSYDFSSKTCSYYDDIVPNVECVKINDNFGICLTPCQINDEYSNLNIDYTVCRESEYWGYEKNLCE